MKHLENLPWENLLYLEADANYTLLHIINGDKLLSSFTLKLHHEYYPSFIRPSRKFIINPKFIQKVDKTNTKVVTQGGTAFTMSRRRVGSVLELLDANNL